jgi:phage terminase large subunit-like protein
VSLSEFLSAVDNSEFEEIPVDLDTFLYSSDYLALDGITLSDYQKRFVEAMTLIYKQETVEKIWPEDADRLAKTHFNEIILMLGKGSGKDAISAIALVRIIYLLLCLKDPAKYYGKPPGDAIHLLNVAINAQQAKNVFFKYIKTRLQQSGWFQSGGNEIGSYRLTAESVEFQKNITAYSGHSERESWEGYNLLVCILDEIAGFSTEAETTGSGASRGKTAEAIYRMYKASVSSRFPKWGKIALLSFPRFKGDFISQRYDEVIADKVTTVKSHTFKIHEDLPDDDSNMFTVEWEEDRIVSYKEPHVYALRRTTWDVNPTISIDDLKNDFIRDPVDSLGRFATMPPETIDAFFKDKQKIYNAFSPNRRSPFDDNWSFKEWFQADEEAEYFVHVDLAYKHDRCAVVMSHVDQWVTVDYGNFKHHAPVVVVDAMRYWTPTSANNVDFKEVEEYILSLIRRGFNIKLVTFDKWNSVSLRQQLKVSYGINTDLLSVAKPHYQDLQVILGEDRLNGYHNDILIDELLGLRIIHGNKVDHPRKGSKDISDALCGSVYNSVAHSKPSRKKKVEVRYLTPSKPEEKSTEATEASQTSSSPMPKDLADFMSNMKVI